MSAVLLPRGNFLSSSRNKPSWLSTGPGCPSSARFCSSPITLQDSSRLFSRVGEPGCWRPCPSFPSACPFGSPGESQAKRSQANSRGTSGISPDSTLGAGKGSGGRGAARPDRANRTSLFQPTLPAPYEPCPGGGVGGAKLPAVSDSRRPPGHL